MNKGPVASLCAPFADPLRAVPLAMRLWKQNKEVFGVFFPASNVSSYCRHWLSPAAGVLEQAVCECEGGIHSGCQLLTSHETIKIQGVHILLSLPLFVF